MVLLVCASTVITHGKAITQFVSVQMLGFVWGVVVERFQHKDLFEQVQTSPTLIAAVIALITVASAIPFYRGVRRSGNPIFTADAELWNGRLAMVSLLQNCHCVQLPCVQCIETPACSVSD